MRNQCGSFPYNSLKLTFPDYEESIRRKLKAGLINLIIAKSVKAIFWKIKLPDLYL